MKHKKAKKNKKSVIKERKFEWLRLGLPEDTKKKIYGVIMFLIAVIISLSFFGKAGAGGRVLMNAADFLIGKTVFILPFLFILGGLVLISKKSELKSKKEQGLIIGGIALAILGITGMLETLIFSNAVAKEFGGLLGYLISFPLVGLFGEWGAAAVFAAVITISGVILYQAAPTGFWRIEKKKESESTEDREEKEEPLYSRVLQKMTGLPEFKIKQIESQTTETEPGDSKERGFFQKKELSKGLGIKQESDVLHESSYKLPSLDLLEKDKGIAYSGDIKIKSSIIKQTLQNFSIPVEMSEINIGPTVTQYTLKPAEGVKLSRITALNNDLSLALAAHPIRIEAPIPGRPLVGIEIPNTKRTIVGMRDLLEQPEFQNSQSHLTLGLGRDVAGNPMFADLAKMPHLLIAGSTGSGKTICLNSIILSLLYKNSPSFLRFVLVDPKRVEFPVYNGLPHLLSPVIFSAQKTIDVLKWLIGEMERRFDVLSEAGARNITGYNEIVARNSKFQIPNSKLLEENLEPLPYIVLIIDELADVMAARGREVEAGIVRLSQMARAVGIHIILATQRPSVEVITGLIKANITSRITFQVASQVDSRTVLDVAGAEKLLGFGDMLFISSDISKPKRAQAVYISEKEVKKVVNYIKTQNTLSPESTNLEEVQKQDLSKDLESALESRAIESKGFSEEDDLLYEDAKKIVIEAKKASASLLQRRLRLGYARAARLIDILEEKGVVGPGEGAKPREVYARIEEDEENKTDSEGTNKEDDIDSDDGYVKV